MNSRKNVGGNKVVKKGGNKVVKKGGNKVVKKSGNKVVKKSGNKVVKKGGNKVVKKSGNKVVKKGGNNFLKPTVIRIAYIMPNNVSNKQNNITISPMTGSEPLWEPHRWNTQPRKGNTNCYSYALNNESLTRVGKAQPGYGAGYNSISSKEYNCDAIYKRIKADNPSITKTEFYKPCPKGFYKAFFALSLGEEPHTDTDYHFYRQDSNGKYSHKPGQTDATNVDASGNFIINPETANRNYGRLNYSKPCSHICVHPEMTLTNSNVFKS